jgi:hypothetical protein
VTPSFVDRLAVLESWQRFPPPANPVADPDAKRRYEMRANVGERLRGDLAGAIEQKRDSARAISIKTLLNNMSPEAVPATLRSEIAALFLELPTGQQAELLNSQWKKIAGPKIIPALRRIDDSAPQTPYSKPPLLAPAVERLSDLEPNKTRTLILDEMNRLAQGLPFRRWTYFPM